MKSITNTKKMVTGALLLAIGMILPFITGQLGALGQLISPLHIPAFLTGLLCGPVVGGVVGIILPVIRSLLFGMPPLVPVAIPMAFELGIYGVVSGLLYSRLMKTPRFSNTKTHYPAIIISLVVSMILGRIAGGLAKAAVMGLTGGSWSLKAFVAAYFTGTLPGAAIHVVLIPAITIAVEKSNVLK